jgi:signal transduction histidine kinase
MHEQRPRLDRRIADALVVAVVAAISMFGLLSPVWIANADPSRVTVPAVSLALVQAGVLWWRRRWPLGVLAVTLGAVLVAQLLELENGASFAGPHVAAYSVGLYSAHRRAYAGLAVLAVAAALDLSIAQLAGGASADVPVLSWPNGVLIGIAWGVGRYVRMRRAYLDTVLAYGHQMEADRAAHARQAVVDERRRIARELHDQVAHHISVVSLQTVAARRWITRDHDRAAAALEAAEQASRTALQTMPVILEALRVDTESGNQDPQPTLADLDALVARVTATGVPVDYQVLGERRKLHPTVELTAYRIIQEALTNTMKHAGPARATVQLSYGRDEIALEVEDDGHGLAAPTRNGAGFGLIGMRERVELLNGSLSAGPRPGGGFAVRAVLPLAKEAAPT